MNDTDDSHNSALHKASIVVPAHNEETRGFGLLSVLESAARELNYLIVVVCNGCNDQTASLARRVPALVVIEIVESGKSNALNVGDVVAGDVFPRLYIDADVQIDLKSLQDIVSSLDVEQPKAAGPVVRYLSDDSPWLIRAYYRAHDSIPFLAELRKHHLDGRGVYGVNRAGRYQFQEFPPIRADDAFFNRMFDYDQKLLVESARVGVPTPSSLLEFFKTQTRAAEGTRELHAWMKAHRPDHHVVLSDQVDPRLPFSRRLRHHLEKGALADSRKFGDIAMTAAYLFVETTTRANAGIRRLLGSEIKWR